MATDWYYLRDGQTMGPITSRELKAMAERGELGPKDLVTKGGADRWATADKLKGLTFKSDKPDAGQKAAGAEAEADSRPDQPLRPSRPESPSPRPERPEPQPQAIAAAAPPTTATVRRTQPASSPRVFDDPADALAALAEGAYVGPAAEAGVPAGYDEPIDLGEEEVEAVEDEPDNGRS